MYFPYYGLQKTELSKSLRSPLSEDPSRRNMVKETEYCRSLNYTTFTIFIDHCEGFSVGKILS